jgi:hypothetical protein
METVASNSQLTVSWLSRQCGILNISQPHRPPNLATGIALICFPMRILKQEPLAKSAMKRQNMSGQYVGAVRCPLSSNDWNVNLDSQATCSIDRQKCVVTSEPWAVPVSANGTAVTCSECWAWILKPLKTQCHWPAGMCLLNGFSWLQNARKTDGTCT